MSKNFAVRRGRFVTKSQATRSRATTLRKRVVVKHRGQTVALKAGSSNAV